MGINAGHSQFCRGEGGDMELDVSYDALMRELKKHGPEVEEELYNHLLEARSRRNLARASGDSDSQSSISVIPD